MTSGDGGPGGTAAGHQAVVRLATPDDAGAVAAIYDTLLRATAVTFEIDEVPADEMRRRVTRTLRGHPWLVAESGGRVLGYAYGTQHRSRAAYGWSADVSVYLDGPARQRGIGRALYTTLLRLLEAQGFANAFAGITLPNPSSVGLHESMGFAPVGIYRAVGWKLGAWHDVGWWQRRLIPTGARPGPVIALPALPAGAVAPALAAGNALLDRRGAASHRGGTPGA